VILRPGRRRSCLAVPGSSPKMLAKADTLPCDQVFIDLEDACAPSQKVPAREHAIEALRTHAYAGKICTVRVNDVTTPYAVRDIVEIVTRAGDRLDCLMIPKVEGADHVHFVHHLLHGLEHETGRTVPVGLEIIVESQRGAGAVREIVAASDRIEAIVFGVGDYEVSMGIPRFEFGVADPVFPGVKWLWAMSEIANHARAAGVEAIDGPYVAFHDEAGYLESARRGRALGFRGKWCVHPSQIALAHAAYSPTEDELGRARAVLDAYERAAAAGIGAAVFDGFMIDEATRKLAAEMLGAAGAAETG
jgi:citrate lyase subunit beta / citryl-CoA lyase